jgi:ABC-type transport system substrate-binding protein
MPIQILRHRADRHRAVLLRLVERDESLRTRRNPKYWQEAPDGKPYPYLNAIEFRPMPNSDARIAALQQGDINMLHTSTAADMAGPSHASAMAGPST